MEFLSFQNLHNSPSDPIATAYKKNDMKQNEHIIERAPTHPIATTIVTKSF